MSCSGRCRVDLLKFVDYHNEIVRKHRFYELFSFFQMAELSHSVISPMSFRVEYKRNGTGPAMFQRHVRFQVSVVSATKFGLSLFTRY